MVRLFSPGKRGYYRSRGGRTHYVCSKKIQPELVDQIWAKKVEEMGDITPGTGGRMMLPAVVAEFDQYLLHRQQTGQPEPLAEMTLNDYRRTLREFIKCVGAEKPVVLVASDDFTKFAHLYSDCAPSSFSRAVAYIQSFFNWCRDEGRIRKLPVYGRYFAKPSRQRHRDARMDKDKSLTPEQIRTLWAAASLEEKCWIGLGLNGAMDNADIANLDWGVIDRETRCIDYRRRKMGKVRRVIPIRPEVVKLLDELFDRDQRVFGLAGGGNAADLDVNRLGNRSGLVFRTPTGRPLQRFVVSRSGKPTRIDYVSMRFGRLLIRAGLRSARGIGPAMATEAQGCGEVEGSGLGKVRRLKKRGSGSGIGFRSFRTSFANLAPRGYREEVELIMGHGGGVLIENYLEKHGLDPLRKLVDEVWHKVFGSPAEPEA